MNVPIEIAAQLRQFGDDVRSHKQHALVPWFRQKIYSLLGTQTSPNGPKIYGWLAVMSAQRVLPLWEAAKPHDNGPRELIELSIGCLRGNQTHDRAKEIWKTYEDRFGVEAIAESLENEQFPVWRPALTAAATFYELEQPHPFLEYLISENDTDQEIDPWAHHAALWAVESLAGAVWEMNSDSSKRLSFWMWWITEAIPMAWSKAGET